MRIAEATWKTGLIEQPSKVKQISKIQKYSENTSLVDVNKVNLTSVFPDKASVDVNEQVSQFRKTQTCVH